MARLPGRGPTGANQGIYKLKKPWKYFGTKPQKITYRSSWESLFMDCCERSANVIKWASEYTKITYTLPPNLDASGKATVHTYVTDFTVYQRCTDGSVKIFVIEIKPEGQTGVKQVRKPSRKTNKSMNNYEKRQRTILVNKFKWDAAVKYCKSRGMHFIVLTEKTLLT